MTAFKLKKKESAKKGIRRVAHDRAEDAVGLLRDEEADPIEAVHEARKDLKKLRATLKLVRPLIGDKTYGRENARFRDAGRALSDVPAQSRQTIDALMKRFPTIRRQVGGGRCDAPRRRRGATGRSNRCQGQPTRSSAAIRRSRTGRWAHGPDLLAPGLSVPTRVVAGAAMLSPSDERLHEWRSGQGPLVSPAPRAPCLARGMSDCRRGARALRPTRRRSRPRGFRRPRMPDRHSHRTARAPAQLIGKAQGTSGEAFACGDALFAESQRFVERIEALLGRGKL
jgi:hypothetical protein